MVYIQTWHTVNNDMEQTQEQLKQLVRIQDNNNVMAYM